MVSAKQNQGSTDGKHPGIFCVSISDGKNSMLRLCTAIFTSTRTTEPFFFSSLYSSKSAHLAKNRIHPASKNKGQVWAFQNILFPKGISHRFFNQFPRFRVNHQYSLIRAVQLACHRAISVPDSGFPGTLGITARPGAVRHQDGH